MITYFINFSVCLSLFWVSYEVFLKRETFFLYNRIYLLITIVLALVLPLFSVKLFANYFPETISSRLPSVYINNSVAQHITTVSGQGNAASGISIGTLFLVLYGIGVMVSLYLFFRKCRKLYKIHDTANKTFEKDQVLYLVPDSKLAFTFYKSIYIGAELPEAERALIVQHEKIHVNEKHSIDMCVFELLRIIFWFHPLIYAYQHSLSALHEYIADEQTCLTVSKSKYFSEMLSTTFGVQNISFINQFFNHSLIKKRIVMLQKSKSKPNLKWKYALLLPLVMLMLVYVSCSEGKDMPEQDNAIEKPLPPPPPVPDGEANNNLAERPVPPIPPAPPIARNVEDVPFVVVDQVPIYPGCEDLKTNEKQKACFSQKISDFVSENFNSKALKPYAQNGENRIMARFKITKNGAIEVVDVRANTPELRKEIEQIISKLPVMTPGMKDGKPVNVLYTLPIIFQVDKKNE